eukprot:CAMPEP_0197313422 /NCGR_PEP_ID=MMETSP0891-20130614/27587_1 /TAXON_ID=44058 ORGANISM="Aureoumbra lagunensis, Strain CCMP1510" /NCGR_SAMPLE_ID=MMETSP0891 /ASSEMBLY_ACC=CAM_ASM_000534 /LENGTH=528 /DNA_ID=CAMNT_0042801265 /DNA_START=86 /DNA_END=1672 /DNA_ORIENTATION=+
MASAATSTSAVVEGMFKAGESPDLIIEQKESRTNDKKNSPPKNNSTTPKKSTTEKSTTTRSGVNEVARAAGRATINLLTQPLTQLQQLSATAKSNEKKKPIPKKEVQVDWLGMNKKAEEFCIDHDRKELLKLHLNMEARIAWTLGWLLIHAIVLWYLLGDRANMWPLLLTAAVCFFIVSFRGPEADLQGIEYYIQQHRNIRTKNQVPTLGMIRQMKLQKKANQDQRPKLHVLGTTLKRSTFSGEPMTWEITQASNFNLRGPNYLKDRKKQPSPEALYEPFGADLLRAAQPFFDLPRYLVLPEILQHERNLPSWLPRIIVQNMWFPGTPPPLLGGGGSSTPQGTTGTASLHKEKGYMVACYWRITPDTAQTIAKDEASWPPHLRLWKRYAQQAETAPVLNGCFKGVASVHNLHDRDLGLPRLVKQYNAKPVLMAASALVGERQGVVKISRDDDYFEFGFNVETDFAAMSNHALLSMKDTFPKLVLDLGWLVEGRHSQDLPEGLLACLRVNKLNLALAPDLEDWLKFKAD